MVCCGAHMSRIDSESVSTTECLLRLSQPMLPCFFFFFLAVLSLHCCKQTSFSSCGKWGLLFVAVYGLIAVASLVEHGL